MSEQFEQIGGITLDYTDYPGEDLYCDGDVEDAILEVVKTCPRDQFESVIREKKNWEFLYHLSSQRGNIVDWIPFSGQEKVLEIGAGPGAITGTLAAKCREVTCVELSKKRSLINAYRNSDFNNVTIKVGNFQTIEPKLDEDYDYIFLIGVFEYAGHYIEGGDPFREELQKIRTHLKPGGRIVIAIENRLGLKYFAGCAEDHTGRYFDSIESYEESPSLVRTFSRSGLEQIFQNVGMSEYSFYYPYPDYKFTSVLYSDRHLPHASELSLNIRNFDRDRLLLFDERKAYKGILDENLYPVFANSYEVILGPALPVNYCKFSGDRDPKYRIRTEIRSEYKEPAYVGKDTDNENTLAAQAAERSSERMGLTGGFGRAVYKYPLGAAAENHVKRMANSYEKLNAKYMGTDLTIAPCRRTWDGGVVFDFIEGRTLESLLDEALDREDKAAFLSLLSEYRRRVGAHEAVPAADYDMTFANIMVNGDTWTAIDYEWEVDEAIPAQELLYRSLLCYYREDEKRRPRVEALIGADDLRNTVGVTPTQMERCVADEQAFQDHVTGGEMSLGAFRSEIGRLVIRPGQLQSEEEKAQDPNAKTDEDLLEEEKRQQELIRIHYYFDTGKGYSEEESGIVEELYRGEGINTFTIAVPKNVKRFRLDPALVPCIALLRKADIEGNGEVLYKYMNTSGVKAAGGSVIFTDNDPWFDWDMNKIRKKAGLRTGEVPDHLHFAVQIAGLPGTMAESMRGQK